MDATLILFDSDTELARARALVDQLWNSNNPTEVAKRPPRQTRFTEPMFLFRR